MSDHFVGLALKGLSMNNMFVDTRHLILSGSVTCLAALNTNLSSNKNYLEIGKSKLYIYNHPFRGVLNMLSDVTLVDRLSICGL